MRTWLCKAFSLMAAAWMLFSLALAEDAERVSALPLPVPENGRLMILPLAEDPLLGPQEDGYLFEEGNKTAIAYEDPSITVRIGRGRIYKTDYVYARVRIADASQLRTLLASPLKSERTVLGTTLAKRVQSVVAINGDFCAKQVRGTVVRQGETLRLNSNGKQDVLLIDTKGDLIILEKATNDNVLAYGEDAVNVFTFGPALVVNGEPRYGYRDGSIATHKAAQRMCLAQTGPLEYLLITSEGPEDPDSNGLKLDQFVELVASFEDVINAYNFDGGSCSTLIFRKGDNNWVKINSPKNSKSRPLKDIIYFADAWVPDPKPTPEPEEASETEDTGETEASPETGDAAEAEEAGNPEAETEITEETAAEESGGDAL